MLKLCNQSRATFTVCLLLVKTQEYEHKMKFVFEQIVAVVDDMMMMV